MKKILLLCFILLLAGCTEITQPIDKPITEVVSGKKMSVHFIDVGQGDSVFIQSPSGKAMLIDAGLKGAGKEVVAYLKAQGVTKLDYLVATHPDADHIGGLVSVLNSISINKFIDSGKVHTSQTLEDMLTLISDKKIPYTVPKTGDTISLDDELKIDVLSADEFASDNNEASIVLRVAYGDISFLLTGDAGISMEKEMMARGDVQSTILKAGHHGSNTSSSQAFIEAVYPQATILSYGQDNKYGHPHAEVITALQSVDSAIYSTAVAGTIVVTTDGVSYEIDAPQWTGIGATSSIQKPAVSTGEVELISKDLQAEIIAIKNHGSQTVNLQDWQLISVEGAQVFNFPNMNVKAGATIYVTSGSDAKAGSNSLEWTKKQIWLNSGDAAQLVNTKGEVVSELQ